jgi:methylthioribulose-1-phosphate dehydratase
MNEIEKLKRELALTIRAYHLKGWSPATSTNYSFRTQLDNELIYVSRSGVDKSLFSETDFIEIDRFGQPISENNLTVPSAETLIHCVIYDLFPETCVILHSHSVYPVLISEKFTNYIKFEGYEIQKGFSGQISHATEISIPLFENTQDMITFSKVLVENKALLDNHSFIIKKHGTYAWGKTLFEAKRHLETLEYLCQCEWMSRND